MPGLFQRTPFVALGGRPSDHRCAVLVPVRTGCGRRPSSPLRGPVAHRSARWVLFPCVCTPHRSTSRSGGTLPTTRSNRRVVVVLVPVSEEPCGHPRQPRDAARDAALPRRQVPHPALRAPIRPRRPRRRRSHRLRLRTVDAFQRPARRTLGPERHLLRRAAWLAAHAVPAPDLVIVHARAPAATLRASGSRPHRRPAPTAD